MIAGVAGAGRRLAAVMLLLAGLLLAGPAIGSAAAAREADPVSSGRVAGVVDGDTVVLEGGTEVRLTGIQAPKLPLGRRGFAAWPLAEESRQALVDLAEGREVRLDYTGRAVDRHGRLLAQVTTEDGDWLQGAMVEAGLARVYGFADNRARLDALLVLEEQARSAGRGIWAHPYYRIRRPEEAGAEIGTFQLVEGVVHEAAVVNGRAFLNFGPDWRQDFTVTAAPAVRRLFDRAGVDLAGFGGERVRVRGWVDTYNGPQIVLTHPEQLERVPR